MSYYPPHQTSGTTYPYASYHPQTPGAYGHPPTPGAYPATGYQPYAPATGVTSYGAAWPYHHGYNYYPQQHQQIPATAPKPAGTTTTQPSTSSTPAPVTATPAVAPPVAPRQPAPSTYTFSSYNRDSAPFNSRSARKGSSYRGMFTKECTCGAF